MGFSTAETRRNFLLLAGMGALGLFFLTKNRAARTQTLAFVHPYINPQETVRLNQHLKDYLMIRKDVNGKTIEEHLRETGMRTLVPDIKVRMQEGLVVEESQKTSVPSFMTAVVVEKVLPKGTKLVWSFEVLTVYADGREESFVAVPNIETETWDFYIKDVRYPDGNTQVYIKKVRDFVPMSPKSLTG